MGQERYQGGTEREREWEEKGTGHIFQMLIQKEIT